jgi:hypothetical protein
MFVQVTMMEKLVPTNGSDDIKGVGKSEWWGREECTLSDLRLVQYRPHWCRKH